MTRWNKISQEISDKGVDLVRKEKLKKLATITGIPLVVYAAEMSNMQKISKGGPYSVSLNSDDKTFFNQVLGDIQGDSVDIILQSPGGAVEAAESIVGLIRSKLKKVRFIIPSMAKSAATMLAMSGDEIIVGMSGELGPTDPQMMMGSNISPAHAILQQFDRAKAELKEDVVNLQVWISILSHLGPSLISECDNAIKLSETLVQQWLEKYMFQGANGKKSCSNC